MIIQWLTSPAVSFIALAASSHAQNAAAGVFPSQVLITMPQARMGEGCILNQNHVLTAASTVIVNYVRLAPTDIQIRAGIIDSAVASPNMAVIRVYAHVDYNQFTNKNNIAMLRVSKGCGCVIV